MFDVLFSFFGKQKWWPGETKEEIIIGAILTQQVSWKNVESAIRNLKKYNMLSFDKILEAPVDPLKELIKPALFCNVKAKYLKNIALFFNNKYENDFESFRNLSLNEAREELLNVKGVGKETADSILLYGFLKPIFPVDMYTIRIFERTKTLEKSGYEEARRFVEDAFKDFEDKVYKFNEFHALLVNLGKNFCFKNNPNCKKCPLMSLCEFSKTAN